MRSGDQTRRMLLVTPVSPYAMASGSEQRSGLMLQALQSLGQVDVVQMEHGKMTEVTTVEESGQTKVLAMLSGADLSLGRFQAKPAFTKRIESQLDHQIGQYDLVVGRYVWPVCQLSIPEHVPTLVDLDDFRFRCDAEVAWSWSMTQTRLSKFVSHRLMLGQLRRFGYMFLTSEQDQRELPGFSTFLLPNVPLSSCSQTPSLPAGKNVLFVGSLWYQPNADAVHWFLQQVWPQVLLKEPHAILTLVGAAPKSLRAQWARHHNVVAPGYVQDLADCYRQARLVVVPIHSGGGTNIKLLEAMAHGRPCVASRFAYRAFSDRLQEGVDLCVADDAAEFTDLITDCFAHPDKFERIAAAGQSVIARSFSRQSFHETVASVATSILQSERSRS